MNFNKIIQHVKGKDFKLVFKHFDGPVITVANNIKRFKIHGILADLPFKLGTLPFTVPLAFIKL